MNYRKLNNTFKYDECDLDSPFEKFTEEEHSKLIVVKKIHQCEESLPASFTQEAEDGDSEFNESQEEKEEELSFPLQSGSYSSLDIYMKTLSRFPPLNEEEEMALVRKIKEQESKSCN